MAFTTDNEKVRVRFLDKDGDRMATRIDTLASAITRYFEQYHPEDNGYGSRVVKVEVWSNDGDNLIGTLNRQQLLVYAEARHRSTDQPIDIHILEGVAQPGGNTFNF